MRALSGQVMAVRKRENEMRMAREWEQEELVVVVLHRRRLW